MLGARINVVEAPIWHCNAYLLPLPDKKPTAAVVKRDKTSGLDRNHRQTWSRLQHTLLIRKGSIKYCLLLLWRFLASHDYAMYEIMSVCMCVKQQTDDWIICLIICMYIVVIICGWNNNVAVKIVACWNLNIYTSSWLYRHVEFAFTINVRCESLNRR